MPRNAINDCCSRCARGTHAGGGDFLTLKEYKLMVAAGQLAPYKGKALPSADAKYAAGWAMKRCAAVPQPECVLSCASGDMPHWQHSSNAALLQCADRLGQRSGTAHRMLLSSRKKSKRTCKSDLFDMLQAHSRVGKALQKVCSHRMVVDLMELDGLPRVLVAPAFSLTTDLRTRPNDRMRLQRDGAQPAGGGHECADEPGGAGGADSLAAAHRRRRRAPHPPRALSCWQNIYLCQVFHVCNI